jgi:hypothetical protein
MAIRRLGWVAGWVDCACTASPTGLRRLRGPAILPRCGPRQSPRQGRTAPPDAGRRQGPHRASACPACCRADLRGALGDVRDGAQGANLPSDRVGATPSMQRSGRPPCGRTSTPASAARRSAASTPMTCWPCRGRMTSGRGRPRRPTGPELPSRWCFRVPRLECCRESGPNPAEWRRLKHVLPAARKVAATRTGLERRDNGRAECCLRDGAGP